MNHPRSSSVSDLLDAKDTDEGPGSGPGSGSVRRRRPESPSLLSRFRGPRAKTFDFRPLERPFSVLNLTESQKHEFLNDINALGAGLPQKSPTKTTLPHEGFSARNEEWRSVQTAIVSLFQQKKLSHMQLPNVRENVNDLVKSDVAPFIHVYYKDHLLKKGMVILRETIKRNEGQSMVNALGDVWSYFFSDILPIILVILHPIKTKELNVRQLTLVGFRDFVLLKTNFEEYLEDETICIPPSIEQMILVIQTVHDSQPANDNYLKVESMAARLVCPYIGVKGVYMGDKMPKYQSLKQQSSPKSLIQKAKSTGEMEKCRGNVLTGRFDKPLILAHFRQSSTPVINSSTLAPLPENCTTAVPLQGRDRRLSLPWDGDTLEATI